MAILELHLRHLSIQILATFEMFYLQRNLVLICYTVHIDHLTYFANKIFNSGILSTYPIILVVGWSHDLRYKGLNWAWLLLHML